MQVIETTEPEDVCRYFDIINGPQGIRAVKVSRKAKPGDIINVYRGRSTKNGVEWKGDVESSLIAAPNLGEHN